MSQHNNRNLHPVNGQYEVESILKRRTNRKTKLYEYFVKWEGWPSTSNTWEPRRNLVDLEDIVSRFDEWWERRERRKERVLGEIRVGDLEETLGDGGRRGNQGEREGEVQRENPYRRVIYRLKRKKIRKLAKKESTKAERSVAMSMETMIEMKLEEPEVQERAIEITNNHPNLEGAIRIAEGIYYQESMVYKVIRPFGDTVWMTKQQLQLLRPDALHAFYIQHLQ